MRKIPTAIFSLWIATGCDPGVSEKPTETSQPIVGGIPVTSERSGFIQLISSSGEGGTGTLLTNFWALTAAHVPSSTSLADPTKMTALMGTAPPVASSRINKHPSYSFPNFDMALVRLREPLEINNSTGFLAALTRPGSDSIPANPICYGYGANATNALGGQLLSAIFSSTGTNSTTFDVIPTIIQRIEPGDSGGPCFWPDFDLDFSNNTLVGVISAVRPNGNGVIGRVSAVSSWIKSVIAQGRTFDYDGDELDDVGLFRPGAWITQSTSAGSATTPADTFSGDQPVRGDFDGDGKTDLGVWRGKSGEWIITPSNGVQPIRATWGSSDFQFQDNPVPGDYDGDGKTDIAVWRATTGVWWILKPDGGNFPPTQWGSTSPADGDVPIPADYDGDGKTDLAVWRRSTGVWHIISSLTGADVSRPFGPPGPPPPDLGGGFSTIIPVPGYYDGDGKVDLAYFDRTTRMWTVRNSSDGKESSQRFGGNNASEVELPVPADYDGDGRTDLATWGTAGGTWRIQLSDSGGQERTFQLGGPFDTPLTLAPSRRGGGISLPRPPLPPFPRR